MKTLGPSLQRQGECEALLRTLPMWFGIEEALLMYARDTAQMPTFAIEEEGRIVGFLTLLQHFPESWEVHCMAVEAGRRNAGLGSELLQVAEAWLIGQEVRFLQVKTVGPTSKSAAYAETRSFYKAKGFTELELFPLLWAPQNPALQLIKGLSTRP